MTNIILPIGTDRISAGMHTPKVRRLVHGQKKSAHARGASKSKSVKRGGTGTSAGKQYKMSIDRIVSNKKRTLSLALPAAAD